MLVKKVWLLLDVVAQSYNPSYLDGGDQKDNSLSQVVQKSSGGPT
jgi:hypothetical protein